METLILSLYDRVSSQSVSSLMIDHQRVLLLHVMSTFFLYPAPFLFGRHIWKHQSKDGYLFWRQLHFLKTPEMKYLCISISSSPSFSFWLTSSGSRLLNFFTCWALTQGTNVCWDWRGLSDKSDFVLTTRCHTFHHSNILILMGLSKFSCLLWWLTYVKFRGC